MLVLELARCIEVVHELPLGSVDTVKRDGSGYNSNKRVNNMIADWMSDH